MPGRKKRGKTALTRSQIMSRIRGRDTGPELAVRRELHAMGVRFRIHAADLPGRPDVVNRAGRWAIFVHGCFWHRHEGCRGSGTPKTNAEAWRTKFAANAARDARNEAAMRAKGFRTSVVWECHCRDRGSLREELAACVGLRRDAGAAPSVQCGEKAPGAVAPGAASLYPCPPGSRDRRWDERSTG